MKFEIGVEADFYGVDCNAFKLNNIVFEAVEDENDGYRSMMSELRIIENKENLIFFETPVARIRIEKRNEGYYGDQSFEGYNLVDINDGFIWLTFGTDMSDTYYPSFTFYYQHKHEFVLQKFEE